MKKFDTPRLHPEWIDPHAYGIVNALQQKGFTTYLVGGCVRDLLLGKVPKDFDIATEATPNEVRKIIFKAYAIGKRFRLVLVKRHDQQYEVATFRRKVQPDDDIEEASGDNFWGTPEQDSFRRDFTVNGLFYDPLTNSVIDHVDGGDDLRLGVVRMIGEPNARLVEDPIRILRAIRLSHLVHFAIDRDLKKAIIANGETLRDSALPRRREEFLKFLRIKDPTLPFLECFDLGVLKVIAPTLHEVLCDEEKSDDFLQYLSGLHDCPMETPTELFAGLILAYFRAAIQPNAMAQVRANEILKNEKVVALMRDEMGMFKYEQSGIAKALQMQSLLQKRQDFERKGATRQLSLLKTESFPLALKIAKREYTLPSQDWHFWNIQYQNAKVEIEKYYEGRKPKRRRKRPGKPRPKPKT